LPKQVLEKNPPKQGLKQAMPFLKHFVSLSFREKSTKTRIETICPSQPRLKRYEVLEKNPPKQGLKRAGGRYGNGLFGGFREKSTKTRIETSFRQQGRNLQDAF